MPQGASQATSALRTVQDAATATENRVRGVGQSFNNAFQATGGSIQIATGIGQIAKSVGDLNLASAGFAGSRVLLELGRVGQDLSQIGGRLAGVGAAFARLNPYLLIASTAMSAVSLAVSLFSNNADDAVTSTERLVTAMEKLNAQSNVARRFGDIEGLGASERKRVGALTDYAVKLDLLPQGSPVSKTEFARETGLSLEELEQRLVSRLSASERITAPTYGGIPGATGLSPNNFVPLRQDSALDILASYRRDLLSRPEPTSPVSLARPGYLPEQSGAGYFAGQRQDMVTDYTDQQKKQFDEAQAAFEAMLEQANQLGQTLGDGAADLLFGLRKGKEVLASMVADFARTGLRNALGALTQSIAGSFNPTGAQGTPMRTPGVNP